jgi:RNA polymerase sigma-70 factor (ECF subfamily)
MLGSAADADDATQDIFLRAYERAGSFDGRSRFSTWLYRLAVRYCLNWLRERSREDARHRAAARRAITTTEPADALDAAERHDLVHRLLAGLPPHYRACVFLREIDGLSYADIADLLDIPRGTVMSRLARARLLLAGRKFVE